MEAWSCQWQPLSLSRKKPTEDEANTEWNRALRWKKIPEAAA